MDDRQHAFLARQPSAALQTREHFWGMPKRGLAFLLANVMFWQPLWAQADGIVVSAPGTGLDRAGNGVPIVNIAKPNGSGLSHNQFKDYNVGSNGVILNNATSRTQSTQLGGIILGNPNLKGAAAKVILNEVNGGNPSQLRGYTEVAGQSAHVIVANPYGITCNGCGFINSPKVTLSTGKPIVENGRLDRYQVDKGSVAIEGAGLNANNVDHFEIITRSARINAEIQAKNLTIIAGRNDVNADTLSATARADDGSAKPQLAIDSSALGGMYAGAIKLVGTEAGVGVKLDGKLIASGGDIQLDANGHLSMVDTSASGAIKVKAASLDARGAVYAGTTLNAQTQGNLTNQQTLAARDSITLNAGGQLSNNGIVEAGVNADTTRNATGDVSVTAQTLNNNGKKIIASRNLTANVGQLNNRSGELSSLSNVTLRVASLDNVAGLVAAGQLLDINGASLDNTRGRLSSSGGLVLTSTGVLNNQSGSISTDSALTLKSQSLNNSQNGLITGKKASIVTTGVFDNTQGGQLLGGDTLDLTATQVSNGAASKIASEKALVASVTGFDQQGGQLFSKTSLSLDLNQGQLNNRGGLINAPLLVFKHLKGVNNNDGGEISSAQAFTLAAQSLNNDNGKLLSSQALALRVNNAVTNLKGLIAAAALEVEAASLDNSGGTLTSRANLDLALTGHLTNQDKGLISATDALTLTSRNLNNQQGSLLGSAIAIDFGVATGDLNNSAGLITTAGILSIRNLRDLNNQNGELSSNQSFTLTARDLDNSAGKLISNGQMTVAARQVINQGGLISGFKGLELTAASLDNRNHGTLSSRDEDVSVTLSGALLNSGDGALAGQKKLTVSTASLDNSGGGILSSGGDQILTVTGGLLNNGQGGLIDSGATLVMNAMTLSNAGGTVNAQQALSFTGTALDNSGGNLIGNAAVTLDLLGALTNTNGKLASAGPLRVERAMQINNQGGQIASQGLLTLLTGGLDNRNRGTVAANDQLVLTATGIVQNGANGLIYSQNAGVQIEAANLANGKGTVQSQGALTLTVDEAIDNQSGRIEARTADLSIGAISLDNRGGVLASLQGLLKTELTGVLKNGYDLNNNRQGGITQAQRLNLTALGGLDNYGGRISAQTGDAIVLTRNFDNRNGGLYAKGKVSVTGNDFDNSGDNDGQIAGSQIDLNLTGVLNNRQGIIESDSTLSIKAASLDNQTGQIRALGSSGKTNFQIGGLFDNRSAILESANADLTLGVGSFLNSNGKLLHVGSGTFDISAANIGGAGGSITTLGGLTLNADTWINTSVIQAGRLNINVNNFTQTATGQLLASTSLEGTGVNWTNDGLIASDGTLKLKLTGSYTGAGRVTSVGRLTLDAASVYLPETGRITGGGLTDVTASGSIINHGRMTANDDLLLSTASLSNYGTLGGAQDLTVNAAQLLNEKGLMFSGAAMRLRSNTLTNNYGDIYSLGELTVARDAAGARADVIENISGSLESAGDMRLLANAVINRRDILTFSQKRVNGYITHSCSHCSDEWNVWYYVHEIYERTLDKDSPSAFITAGGNLTVTGSSFLNQYSSVSAARDINISVDTFNNEGVNLETIVYRSDYKNPADREPGSIYLGLIDPGGAVNEYNKYSAQYVPLYRRADGGYFYQQESGLSTELNPDYDPTKNLPVPEEVTRYGVFRATQFATTGKSIDAVIQSGGSTSITATTTLNNSVQTVNAPIITSDSKVDDTGTLRATTPFIAHINSQLPPDLAQQRIDPLTLPGFVIPEGQNGLFRLSGQGTTPDADATHSNAQNWAMEKPAVMPTRPNSRSPADVSTIIPPKRLSAMGVVSTPPKYLIETNPVLTDLKQFMSSDYLLANLGYDPDQSAKRLGDGLYEQRLIQQAVLARTGQRFLDGQTSNEDMFKYLMDNAVASKQALNLAVGVSLTSQQVAALTHDIVWMENVEVNGEQVLVPVLYLANANNRLAANGALIQGKDVTLIAGKDLNNAGTLRASNNLSATAANDLTSSGLVEAGNRLDLLVGNNLVNKAGGIIAGRDVSLTTVRGDVVNERTVTNYDDKNGEWSWSMGFADSAARIEATNNLSIDAGRDFNTVGSVVSSGRDLTIEAGRDVNIVSAQKADRLTDGGDHDDSAITQLGSQVLAGRDLTVTAERDVTAVASEIEAKRDVGMSAVGDMTLASAADEVHSYNKGARVTKEEDHVRQVATVVTAGGNVVLSAGKDLGLIASRVSAGDEAYLVAGANLVLQSAKDSDYSFYSKTKKSSSGKKFRLDETSSVTNVASSVTSGGNNVLTAGNDLLIKGSNVISEKGSVGLGAGNDVEIVAVTDSESARHERSKSKSSWGGLKSSKVQDKLAETQTTAVGSMISGDTIAVIAKRDATITGSALVSTDDLTVRAGRDLTIDAAENTFSRTQMHKEKNRDLTGVLTGNNLGIDDITGNQHLSISNQKHNGTASQTTLTGSTIGSSKGNVSLVAGGDLNVIASDLVSTKGMSLRGSNVTIAAGMETADQSTVDKAKSLAVGRVIGGAIVDTVNTIRSSVEAAKDADDPRLKAVKLAQAALAAYNLGGMASDANDQKTGFADKQGGTASNGSLIKIGTEIANTRSKSTSNYASQTTKQSTLNAGTTLSIIANGNAAQNDGDLHVIGSSIKAVNTSLLASNDIILESAQNTADWSNRNSNNKTAIGASFNIGQQNGFTLDLGAQLAKGMGDGSSVTQVNTTVDTGSLLLRSGGDTTLAGAQVRADEINALIDGNLNIISRQDTQDQKSKQSSGGFGASICIPPFCYGTPVAASANLAAGNMNSEYKGVTDQTGLFAGTGGYTVDVGKTTTLEGGVIASDASADKNLLITDRLVARDIKNVSEIEAQSAGIGISGSYGGAGASASVGGLYGIALSESDKSHTRSAVSEGTIIVRNPEGAQDTVGLNRDTKNANEHLDKPDEEAMNERIELVKSSVELVKGISSAVAAEKIKEAQNPDSEAYKVAREKLNDSGVASPTPEQISQQVQRDYGTGSSFQKASQAVAGIVQGILVGDIGALVGGAAAPYLAQAVKQMTEGDDAANLMAHAVLGAVLAKAQGGSALAGAAGATVGELIASQLYPGQSRDELTESEKQTIAALSTLAGGFTGALAGGDAFNAALGAGTAKNAVENNHLSDIERLSLQVLQREYESSCNGSTTSDCQDLSSEISELIAKNFSVLKEEVLSEDNDFTRAMVHTTSPGDVISCATSPNGFCVATDKTITTDQGEEWVLQPASFEQAIGGKARNELDKATTTAQLQGISNELFSAGCGGAGVGGIACQGYMAAGGENPITGEVASNTERVMWGIQGLLNAWGLGGSLYSVSSKGLVPSGFASAKDFSHFGGSVRDGLLKAGYTNVDPILQGSAITGKSYRTGQPFDVGRTSDFDIALASPELLNKASSLGIGLRGGATRTGPLSARDLKVLGLEDLATQLSRQAGRDVNFMIYGSTTSAISRAPSVILPRN
ncbi:hemagglutinin repeat-containing protein [Pseudomonas sp. Q11]|uniref:two-partner secretion domain-containing protein n=1 Tax=Pseudomonas sp. Q11 TaxID=2968470 RepID=UPI00210D2E7B|nr:hemagglutinin repeat-containing protein [Pseudomonas sp. Q11]MCQ6260175.1 hemagglutinin repeat-containing protein [Pseudomonas sp. Q11]